jgi:hypothetical protein
MVETMNFKKGETLAKLKVAITNLNVWEMLMLYCKRHFIQTGKKNVTWQSNAEDYKRF